jgi:hypothetical protein
MRVYSVAIFVVGGLLLLGCIPSYHPLFTPADVAFDPDLVGTWTNEEEDETLQFTAAEEKSYRLVYTDEQGKTGTFEAHLTKIDGHLFLDIFPKAADLPQNAFFKIHLVPAHSFLLIHEISPQQLELSAVNARWLGEYLEEHPDALKHETRKQHLMLTASTEQLRKFFAQHATTPKAFGDPSTLKRVGRTAPSDAESELQDEGKAGEEAEESK